MKLLVSVRNPIEASDALLGGADWIDLKEPSVGPLGAVSAEIAGEVAAEVGDSRPLSAALGELIAWDYSSQGELLDVPQIAVVKLGLAHCGQDPEWQTKWRDAFENCSRHGKDLCAVIYADWRGAAAPCPEEVVESASLSNGKYLLIDTFEKRGGSSIDCLGELRVAKLLHTARTRGMTTVLAGNLRLPDVPRLATMAIDLVAVRGAVCRGERTSQLDACRVHHFRHALVEPQLPPQSVEIRL